MKSARLYQKFSRLSPSRRLQWLGLQRDKLLTQFFHSRRLKACGRKTIVQKPLFWTPEFIELGENVHVWPYCRLEAVEHYADVTFTPNIRIGNGTTFQQNCHITAAGKLEIGRNSNVLFGAVITDIDHGFEELDENFALQPIRVSKTVLGQNCFIGAGAVILAGTELGDNCVVGANSVVRGRFDSGSVIAGCPGRTIRVITSNK